jgi:N utilization substance protein B
MGKRSTARRLAMQAVYQSEISQTSIKQSLKNIFESEKFIDETADFAAALAKQAWEKRAESDAIVKRLSKDWPLDRIGRVDLSILRLALFELSAGESPGSVVIDEAVELAKKYSGIESAKFINGILGSYMAGLSK